MFAIQFRCYMEYILNSTSRNQFFDMMMRETMKRSYHGTSMYVAVVANPSGGADEQTQKNHSLRSLITLYLHSRRADFLISEPKSSQQIRTTIIANKNIHTGISNIHIFPIHNGIL